MVPLARVERALLAELDFESSASTNSATGARPRSLLRSRACGNGRLMGQEPERQEKVWE